MKIPKLTIGLYLLASAAAHTLAVYDASTFGLIYGLIFGGACIALWVALAFLLRVQENARKDADARTESAIAAAWRGYNEWFNFHVGEADRLMAELRASKIEPIEFKPTDFGSLTPEQKKVWADDFHFHTMPSPLPKRMNAAGYFSNPAGRGHDHLRQLYMDGMKSTLVDDSILHIRFEDEKLKVNRIERNEFRSASLSKLPPMAFATIKDKVVMVKRGQRGYEPAGDVGRFTADELNERMNVPKHMAAALMIGAAFGFDAPGADPDFWSTVY